MKWIENIKKKKWWPDLRSKHSSLTGALLLCMVLSDKSLSGMATNSDSVSSPSKLESWYLRENAGADFCVNRPCLPFVPWLVPSDTKSGLIGGVASIFSSCSVPIDGWLMSLPRGMSITTVAGIRLQRWNCASSEFNTIRIKLPICTLNGGCVYSYLYMITSTDMSQLRRTCASRRHNEYVYEVHCVFSLAALLTLAGLGE